MIEYNHDIKTTKIILVDTKDFFLNKLEIAAVKIIYHGSFYISVYVKNYTEVLKARKIFLLNKELVIAKIKQEIITRKLHDNVESLLWNENSCSFYSYEDSQINKIMRLKLAKIKQYISTISPNNESVYHEHYMYPPDIDILFKPIYEDNRGYILICFRKEDSWSIKLKNSISYIKKILDDNNNSYQDKFNVFFQQYMYPTINLTQTVKRLKNIGVELCGINLIDETYSFKIYFLLEETIKSKEFSNVKLIEQLIRDELNTLYMSDTDRIEIIFGPGSSIAEQKFTDLCIRKIPYTRKKLKQEIDSKYLPQHFYLGYCFIEFLYPKQILEQLSDEIKQRLQHLVYDILSVEPEFKETFFDTIVFSDVRCNNIRAHRYI